MIYLDTSAIVKLVRREAESPALVQWLDVHSTQAVVTSVLAELELLRVLRRVNPRLLSRVGPVLAQIDRFEIDDAVRASAGAFTERNSRSLDAIHLATAVELVESGKSMEAFVTYDRQLARIADAAGLTCAHPT